jgi:hypothetical protein
LCSFDAAASHPTRGRKDKTENKGFFSLAQALLNFLCERFGVEARQP